MSRFAKSLILLAIAASVHADSLNMDQQYTLTAIDSVPTPTELGKLWPDPTTQLTNIASDAGQDTGIRLRAIHALVHYCSPCSASNPPHVALTGLIRSNAGAPSGGSVLLLRAAIEAIGPLRVTNDLSLLLPLLDHQSRDIRATTATALRAFGDPNAVCSLRVRLQSESIEQVRLAISDALRVLGPPPQPCVN